MSEGKAPESSPPSPPPSNSSSSSNTSPPPSSSSPSSNNSPPPSNSSSSSNNSPPPSNSPSLSNNTPPPSPSSPPPNNESSQPSPPTQNSSPPPPQEKSSPSPPPSDGSSSKPPPPKSSSDSGDSNSSKSPPPPLPPTSASDSNSNGNNMNTFSPPPPPPQRDSSHGSQSNPRSLGPPDKGGSTLSDNGGTPNLPAIIGVAAGAGLLLLVMLLLCCCCFRKKKRKPKYDEMQYYGGNSAFVGRKAGGEYYDSGLHQQVVNLPPAHGSSWGHSPPPPPGNWVNIPSPQGPVSGNTGNSSDMSSNFSGPHGPSLPPPPPSMALGYSKSTFTYDELAAATQGFSKANLLGQGGFGFVHKGVLPNGKEIAVKSLKTGSGQGEREFQAEVEIISRVHHRHLVSLVGYCIAAGQRMLVYEFVPNNTLEFHLHGQPTMDWPTRQKIALGSARGLAYLHEDCHPRIIHRDIKAANILLDFNFEAKVADFGLAKLSQDNITHVSTRVMGTFGYLAPEYASSGKLTEKSDVFSFGVMLLELITGRRPVDVNGDMEDSLVDWARSLCLKATQDGDYSELVDPRLEGNYDQQEMARMVSCAAAAIRHSARRRPKMSQIQRALEGDASLEDLNDGVKPGQSSYLGGSSSSDYDASSYSADMRKFRKLALNSREYPSSEFGATSEYGLDPSSSSSEEMHRGRSGPMQ